MAASVTSTPTTSRRHRRHRDRERRQHQGCGDAHQQIARILSGDRGRCGFAARSRSGFRNEAAEPALASGIFGDRAFQRRLVEIRPVDRHEHELAVGRLPHQEIRQPLLAAGADDQIGIGNVGRIEILPERIGIDRGRIALAFRDLARQPLRGVRDLLPRTVVEGDDEGEFAVFCFVSSSASLSSAQMSGSSPARSPITRTLTPSRCKVARSLRMKRRSRPKRSPISLAGRDQFSELKEKIVR